MILTSITYVYKVKELLARENIKSYIIKLQASYERRGCGYGLEIAEHHLPFAVSLAERYQIRIMEIKKSDDD
jgi:hypothetical protein